MKRNKKGLNFSFCPYGCPGSGPENPYAGLDSHSVKKPGSRSEFRFND
jgi:hypothetical protein